VTALAILDMDADGGALPRFDLTHHQSVQSDAEIVDAAASAQPAVIAIDAPLTLPTIVAAALRASPHDALAEHVPPTEQRSPSPPPPLQPPPPWRPPCPPPFPRLPPPRPPLPPHPPAATAPRPPAAPLHHRGLPQCNPSHSWHPSLRARRRPARYQNLLHCSHR